MAAIFMRREVAPETLRLRLLAYGLDNAYRVVTLEEITQSLRQFNRDQIRDELNRLADDGLLMKFSGRYCFNKAIPKEIRNHIRGLGAGAKG